jgi:hypothetical protein
MGRVDGGKGNVLTRGDLPGTLSVGRGEIMWHRRETRREQRRQRSPYTEELVTRVERRG